MEFLFADANGWIRPDHVKGEVWINVGVEAAGHVAESVALGVQAAEFDGPRVDVDGVHRCFRRSGGKCQRDRAGAAAQIEEVATYWWSGNGIEEDFCSRIKTLACEDATISGDRQHTTFDGEPVGRLRLVTRRWSGAEVMVGSHCVDSLTRDG